MWKTYDWLNKFYNLCMTTVVSIVSRHGLRIEAHHRNQHNKTKLALYKPLYCHLKQLYISNKTEHFNYKGGCDIMCIEVFKGELV